MTKESSGKAKGGSTFAERLDFAIRLAALRKGFESSKELAAAIGKGQTQISQWKRSKPKIDAIRLVAGVAGVSPSWLDEPTSPDAVEPELFQEWLAARRSRARAVGARKRA
jgi:transcriptional regulator with XRE-family HTH domain